LTFAAKSRQVLCSDIRKSNQAQGGQAALLMTFSLTVVMGMLGLVVDLG